MSILCECGASLSLPKVGATKCGVDFGQIQMAAFFDTSDTPTVGTDTPTSLFLKTNLCDKTNWTTLLAVTSPKVTTSPEMYNTEVNPGSEQTWEGNNGVKEHVDTDPTEITAEMRRAMPAQVKELQKMRCLAQAGRLGVIFFDGNGLAIGASGTTSSEGDSVVPIKVDSIFVGDRKLTGRSEPDYYQLKMELKGEWSLDLAWCQLNKVGGSTQDWRGVDLLS